MQTIDETRRDRLEQLIREYGSIAALNEAIGLARTDSTLSQVRTKSLHSKSRAPRTMGDDQARRIEERLGKPRGWMDTPLDQAGQDPRLAHILATLAALPEWQRDQVVAIVDALAKPPPGAPAPG